MRILVDTHTHSVASGHAYSTVQEDAKAARRRGLRIFALTDHGPAITGGTQLYHFGNLKVIPPVLYGVRMLKGVEANILDFNGSLDMPEDYLARLDFVLAGFHELGLEPGSEEENTAALCRVMENPWVDAISHPGNPVYPIDIEAFVDAAYRNNRPVEMNNSSFVVRRGSAERCELIARACVKRGVRVICGSDAHISFDIGRFDHVLALFRKVGMPRELVLNASVKAFDAYLEERHRRIVAAVRPAS